MTETIIAMVCVNVDEVKTITVLVLFREVKKLLGRDPFVGDDSFNTEGLKQLADAFLIFPKANAAHPMHKSVFGIGISRVDENNSSICCSILHRDRLADGNETALGSNYK